MGKEMVGVAKLVWSAQLLCHCSEKRMPKTDCSLQVKEEKSLPDVLHNVR